MAYVRTVKTASGATAVQIVWSSRRGSRPIEHLGSAHDEAEVEALKAAAASGWPKARGLDLGLTPPAPTAAAGDLQLAVQPPVGRAVPRLRCAGLRCRSLGGDEVLRDLVLARIIEPTSKIDAERVLAETGVASASLPHRQAASAGVRQTCCTPSTIGGMRGACRVGAGHLVLFDVSTLYFETDTGDGFREPGFSKERRLEPQITLGLLTDAAGFPLAVEAFEGNKAETATMLPVINAFKAAHQLTDVTVVADAGMISEANQVALQAAGLSYILGARIPFLPDVVREWRDKHPDEAVPDSWC